MDQTAERAARNDAIFREANEGLGEKADELEITERIPFLCECADPSCTDVVLMSRSEYEHVRALPNRFLSLPGHSAADGGHSAVVEQHPDYLVVEKVGRAAEIAAELDPRSRRLTDPRT